MNKPVIFKKIVGPMVWEALKKAYGINVTAPSEKQEAFVEELASSLYEKVGCRLDKTTLREIYGDNDDLDTI